MKNYFAVAMLLVCFSFNAISQVKQFRNNLYIIDQAGKPVLMDGTLSLYHADYSNEVDNQDARKMTNPGENLGILRDGKTLSIERRQDITNADTIFFKFWNARIITYRLELSSKNMDNNLLEAVLHDTYLNTKKVLTLADGNFYDFQVTADVNSKKPDRFMVIFNSRIQAGLLPLSFIGSSATSNDQGVSIRWKTENEQNVASYHIERSKNGIDFESTGLAVRANNQVTNSYAMHDANPTSGISYYRIRATDLDGKVTLSKIMKVNNASVAARISLYPNPATPSNIQLYVSGQQEGTYKISVYTSFGTTAHTQTEMLASNPARIKIAPIKPLPQGIYRVEITGPANYRSVQNLLISK